MNEWKKTLKGLPAAKIKTNMIGKKKLAYKQRGNTYGWYVAFKYESTEDLIHSSLDLRLRKDDDVIKFLTMDLRGEDADYTPDQDQDQDQNCSLSPEDKIKTKTPVDVFDLIFEIKKEEI